MHKNSSSGFNEPYLIIGKKLPVFSFETKYKIWHIIFNAAEAWAGSLTVNTG